MTDNFIQLGKSNTLKLGIRTDKGEDTGEFLEFDLQDIELPLKYQELIERDKKNKQSLRNKMLIIDKQEDHKGKKLLSFKEELQIKALNDFFNEEIEIYNMFLGDHGVQKLLNGRKIGWTTLEEIDELIEKQILPHLEINMNDITNKIKEKYNQAVEKSKNVLK